MNKITFINNQAPSLNATNLNQMQDNIESSINQVQNQVNGLIETDTTTSSTNVYSCTYINEMFAVYIVSFSTGTISAGGDLYNKTYTITTTDVPSGYTPIGVIGESKSGNGYSHCPFTMLCVSGTGHRSLLWAMKNTFSSAVNLSVNVWLLCKKD